jgi:O-antigen ligase
MLTAFTIWMILGTPFSVWKGGSVMLLKDTWSRSLLTFFLIAGLVYSLRQCRIIIYTIGFSIAVIAVTAVFSHTLVEGSRWALPVGTLANPNDLAQYLLVGIPFLWYMSRHRNAAMKLTGYGGMAVVLFVTAATGSRGGMIAVAIMLLVLFFQVSMSRKIMFVFAAAVLMLALGAMLPDALVMRYNTIFGSGDQSQINEATASADSRFILLKQSLYLTLVNPVFGVGAGQFQAAAKNLADEEGTFTLWRDTHNLFTQVSSETGIPGFFLYIGALGYCLVMMYRFWRSSRGHPELQDISNPAAAIFMSLVGFSATSFFSSTAYHFSLPVLLGISTAFILMAREELAARAEQAAANAGQVANAADPPAAELSRRRRLRQPQRPAVWAR